MDNEVSDGAVNMAARVQSSANDFADAATNQAQELTGKATVAARDAYGQVRDQMRDAGNVVANTVTQQPLMALLVTGFVCAMAGFLWARR